MKGPCPRSMEVGVRGTWCQAKANLACLAMLLLGLQTAPPSGEVCFPINTIVLALTFSFPGSDILFRQLRSLPGSKHLTVPLSSPSSLESVILLGEARPWYAPWLLTGNPSASCLRTSRLWRLWVLIQIEPFRTPLGTFSHILIASLTMMLVERIISSS